MRTTKRNFKSTKNQTLRLVVLDAILYLICATVLLVSALLNADKIIILVTICVITMVYLVERIKEDN